MKNREVANLDKYEYKLRSDEIMSLIKKREFQKAVEIADTIDWTRVRSATTLCTISDLYKINRRYNEAKILLEQAYTRCPNGKSIVYSLCELCIKMDEVVPAMEYYKKFVQMAPTENGKFVLLYKLYEAQDASLEERIECLEELKKRERTEKWCYELAYLYHRIGLITKCVEECDDLILWFREGKYIKKAMELKMLYQALTEEQEQLYRNMLSPKEQQEYLERTAVHDAAEEEVAQQNEEIYVKPMDLGQYSTINIQQALADSIKGTFSEEADAQYDQLQANNNVEVATTAGEVSEEAEVVQEEQPGSVTEAIMAPMMQDTGEMTELFFENGESALVEDAENSEVTEESDSENETKEDTSDSLEYASTAKEDNNVEDITVIFPNIPATEETLVYTPKNENGPQIVPIEPSETATEETAPSGELTEVLFEEPVAEEVVEEPVEEAIPKPDVSNASKEELMELIDRKVAEALDRALNGGDAVARTGADNLSNVAPPRSMQKMLSQEYDGQISLVVPEEEQIEKQITGQIDIEEFLSSWEDTKKKKQEKHQEEIKRRVLEQTGNLFTDFEASARDGILEKLESENGIEKAPIDADQEYREYLKKVMEEQGEAPEQVEEATDVAEEAEVAEAPISEASQDTVEEVSEENSDDYPPVEEIAEITEEPVEIAESTEEATDVAEEVAQAEVTADSSETSEEPAQEVTEVNEQASDESQDEAASEDGSSSREMTEEESALFSQFVQTKKAKKELASQLDMISLAAYTGNVFVTGDTQDEALELARNVMQYARTTDANFSGKVGKVSGSSLNEKAVDVMIEKLANGGLIIEKAGDMRPDTVEKLLKSLNQEKFGVFVVMQDTKNVRGKFMSQFEEMKQIFNIHIQIEELSDDALVAYGRKYADHLEYSIDEMGILALHTRIDELQTSDHVVTVADVRDIVDEAIEKATKFSFKHVTDVMFGKRYDDDDMIILKERDFLS